MVKPSPRIPFISLSVYFVGLTTAGMIGILFLQVIYNWNVIFSIVFKSWLWNVHNWLRCHLDGDVFRPIFILATLMEKLKLVYYAEFYSFLSHCIQRLTCTPVQPWILHFTRLHACLNLNQYWPSNCSVLLRR